MTRNRKRGNFMRHNFYIGQELYWHVNDFEGNRYIRCFITEVHPDHAIARTQGNECKAYDDMNLWIDWDNEMDFFDATILKIQLAGL